MATLGDPNYPAPLWHVPLELNGSKVNALFDPGAGMSFISADFVKSLGLKTQNAPKLAVRVASGQRQRSTQQVVATVKVGKQICKMTFRVLRQLRVAPLVLGLQQLKELDVSVHLRSGLIQFPDGSTVQ